MSNKKHIVMLMANNSSVPYFNWFAERSLLSNEYIFSFVALHNEKPRMIEEMEKRGLKCYWIYFDPAKRQLSMIKAVFKLFWLFKKIKPDIVFPNLFDDTLPSLIAAKLAGIKVRHVIKQDTGFHWNYAPKGIKYDRLINRFATELIAVSTQAKNFIIDCEKANPKKVFLIPSGLPVESTTAQSEARKQFLKDKYQLHDKIVIGSVGRLIHWKGHKIIIETARLLVKKYPQIRFVIAGEGELKDELLQLAKEYNVAENFILTGWMDRNDIPSFYGVMDIYFHSAYSMEPFGYVMAEAMMNAVPIVSTNTGCATDIMSHKVNGYIVGERTALCFANGIEFILQNKNLNFGEEARKISCEKLNFETYWQAHTNLFKKSLGI